MKNLIYSFLVIAITLSNCGPKQPTEAEKAKAQQEAEDAVNAIFDQLEQEAEPTDSLGIWEVAAFVDDFDEPTDNKYIRLKSELSGTFSNSATQDSELDVKFLITGEADVCIMLYEYAGSNPVKARDDKYKIKVKPKKGEAIELSAKNWSDRICLGPDHSKKLTNLLEAGGSLKFSIIEANKYGSPASYKFTVKNADGFDLAMSKLME